MNLNLVLNGFGKMGKETETVLKQRGHSLKAILKSSDDLGLYTSADIICIDFTSPSAFKNNYRMIADKFRGAIIGTTGWYDIFDEVRDYFSAKNKKLIYGTNFSVGVNIMFELTAHAGALLSKFGYSPYIVEYHHTEKKDAPSGTAETLKKILETDFKNPIPVSSVRSGYIKGIHDTGYESKVDKINIRHEAYSREGFALGAVIAAEWIDDVDGVIEFKDLFRQKTKNII